MAEIGHEYPDQVKPDSKTARTLFPGWEGLAKLVVTREGLLWLSLAVAAVVTRFWNLSARVMSHDESLHVYYSWIFSKGGGYVHNPMMHGPFLFEVTGFFDFLFGATDFTSRILPALLGIGIVVGVPLLLRPWLGRWGAFAAGLLFLVSPYVLFYSRYNRHDIEEIAWALLAAFAIFSYLRRKAPPEDGMVDAADSILQPIADSTLQPMADSTLQPMADPALQPAADIALQDEATGQETPVETPPATPKTTAQVVPTTDDGAEKWLLMLAGCLALMFSSMETAFFYLAIFVSFLVVRLLVEHGFNWRRIRHAPELDLIVVMATLGAFFSSPIALLALNPLWNRITGSPFVPVTVFNTYGIEWSTGQYGVRIWSLMAAFWAVSAGVGLLWNAKRWWKIALVFLLLTLAFFTTFSTNKAGFGTGYIGSLGYWLSQQGVARGSQPWYYYFIVYPLYEYLPLVGGIAAVIYFAIRRRFLLRQARTFVLFAAWWALWIFVGLTGAGEKMPWLSTHITIPFILLTAWLVGQIIQRGWETPDEYARLSTPAALMALAPLAILFLLTVRTAYFVNYVNYDYTTEFVGYAHGAPGIHWAMEDIAKIAEKSGQGKGMTVAYDSDVSWPLTWYLRDHPGFFGDQPNRGSVENAPVVIVGSKNWDKVESYLGPNYNRYEVIRMWWPMEDYKNLSWDRIRGALTDPKMRQAVWNIIWARDYSLYAQLTNEQLDAPKDWPLQDRMRIYIRKDLADQVSGLMLKSSQIADLKPKVDEYASKRIELNPTRTLTSGDLNAPRNLALAPDGTIYVADSGNARIVHLNENGNVLGSWGSHTPDKQTPPAPGTFFEPWGLAVDAQGNVYVADTWNHRVQKFDANGKFLLQWGVGGLRGDGPDRFWGPRGLAIGPNGTVYVTDTGNRRVAAFDAQGKFLFDFASDGQAALNEPVGITIDPSGRVLVVDTWNNRVAIFDQQGKFLASWPVTAWGSASINNKPFIAVDANGKVYLSDPEGGRVLVFTEDGAALATFGQAGSTGSTLDLPTGVVVSPQGELLVADAGNNRLVVYPTQKP